MTDDNVIPLHPTNPWKTYDRNQDIEDCISNHPAFVNGEPVNSLPEVTEVKERTLRLVKPETAEKGLEA
jgi:hypothetical protein